MRLPANLERRLAELFPKVREREKFVAQILEEALTKEPNPENDLPKLIGGVLHLFSDGGSRGNPGQAAIAAILEDPVKGEVLDQIYERIGVETNNVAEYRALIEGLKMALAYQPNRLICHLDSELVVKQVRGEYQVKMATLKPFVDEIRELSQELADVVFEHIPRGDNHRADALVNKALDELPDPTPHAPRPTPQASLFNEPSHKSSPGDSYRQQNQRSSWH